MTIDPAETKAEEAKPEEANVFRIKLKSNDGVIIEVDEDVALQCHLIRQMMRDLGLSASSEEMQEPIGITHVNGKTLEKIMEWCTIHRRDPDHVPKREDEDQRIHLTPSDNQYMNVSSQELVDILMAANFLDIPGIIDIVTQKIANMATGKSVEQLRELYGLENDFTPEEEEEMRRRFEWIEQ